MSTVHSCDVAIVGGGLTGFALAAALGQDDVDTVVIDHVDAATTPPADADPRVTAIALGSARFLRAVGAFEAMAAAAQPILDIEVREGRSPIAIHYDHRDVGDEPLGWIVPNAAIRDALVERVRSLASVRLWMPARYMAIERDPTAATLTLEDGRRLRARLLVAADGKFSKLRDALGIRTHFKSYAQTGLVATLGHSQPHDGLATEHFFPDGPFAVLPMRGDRSSIVWALDDALATTVANLPASSFLGEVADRVGERLGALELLSPVKGFPLVLSRVDRFVSRRAALVGDAAHGLHPIAGQGWNLALRDVAALAELVADARALGLDVGDACLLDDYERWRGTDTAAMIGFTDGINRLFANDLTPLRLARNAGFAMVERWPAAKRLFMRHAMGLMGDLPVRMRPPSPANRSLGFNL